MNAHWPTLNEAYQTAHVSLGALIVLAHFVAGGKLRHAPLAVCLWVIPKEFVIDIWLEGDTFADGILDSLFYLIGAMLGWLYCFYFCKPGRRVQ